MTYPSFLEHIRSRYGRNWCIAPRASARTARYDTVITPKQYAREQEEWAAKHPAMLMVQALPEGPVKELIVDAVRFQLRAA